MTRFSIRPRGWVRLLAVALAGGVLAVGLGGSAAQASCASAGVGTISAEVCGFPDDL